MNELTLPADAEFVRSTPMFDSDTTPAGLLAAHQIAANTWGLLRVDAGAVDFVFEDDPDTILRLRAGDQQVVPPLRAHHISVDAEARFAVEFHRVNG
ncbi:MAG: DUF1971 domain-containing protein [Actinomycetota bacterium]|nr:DUF1971 domain-containing protein [Actinomycetota bacterium]